MAAAVLDVLLTSLSLAKPLMDLTAEYYQGITLEMWLDTPAEDLIGIVPPDRRALAAVLSARVRAIARGDKKRVQIQLNRAGVYNMKGEYINVREAAERVQALLAVEYARLHAGSAWRGW